MPTDDESLIRRGSTGEAFPRKQPTGELHVRHSSAGLNDLPRRGSVDSDGDVLDEVSEIGAPWEPAFDRRPQGTDALDWMMVCSNNVSVSPFLSFRPSSSPDGITFALLSFLILLRSSFFTF